MPRYIVSITNKNCLGLEGTWVFKAKSHKKAKKKAKKKLGDRWEIVGVKEEDVETN